MSIEYTVICDGCGALGAAAAKLASALADLKDIGWSAAGGRHWCQHCRAERGAPGRPALSRPDGVDPDGFSERFAAAYRDAVMTSRRPAVTLAQEAGVPVGTVHRWIREARARGHLSPAQRGRAG